jgi:hypothetical protein
MPSDVIRRWGTGSHWETGSKTVFWRFAPAFLAKTGGARYQVRAFSALLPNALHGPPQ